MIDEYWTWIFYGYHSDELSHGSHKPIVARCDGCCKYRIAQYKSYYDCCPSCGKLGRVHSPETRLKMSESATGKTHTEATRLKLSIVNIGRVPTDDARIHMSAAAQGIPYEDWNGFIKENPYCEKFDEACRERIREKYDRLCFVCNKNEEDNGRKLSVHHVDKNREQGCNGVEWNLIPLCISCHRKSHFGPLSSRITYLLNVENM